MRIKTTKQMRLDELIKYMRENEIKVTEYVNNVGGIATFSYGQLSLRGGSNFIDIESPFKVPVEEELTEDTVFDALTEIYWDSKYQKIESVTIPDSTISKLKMSQTEIFKSLAIYHKDTLIWSKETGIPEEGVIEV